MDFIPNNPLPALINYNYVDLCVINLFSSPFINLVFSFIPCKVLFSVSTAILSVLSDVPVSMVFISACPRIFLFVCVPVIV